MASKKPAKAMAGQAKDNNKTLAGKAVMYFGSKNAAPFICPNCNRSLIKGIIYEESNDSFCSRRCIGVKNA
jgi:hypothetical protein